MKLEYITLVDIINLARGLGFYISNKEAKRVLEAHIQDYDEFKYENHSWISNIEKYLLELKKTKENKKELRDEAKKEAKQLKKKLNNNLNSLNNEFYD
jgi:hypothetical protein